MTKYLLSIDDYVAQASPVLGRRRLDGLTEAPVPFAERVVLLWRRGAPSRDMGAEVLIDVLQVRLVSSSVLEHCARCCECTNPPDRRNSTGLGPVSPKSSKSTQCT